MNVQETNEKLCARVHRVEGHGDNRAEAVSNEDVCQISRQAAVVQDFGRFARVDDGNLDAMCRQSSSNLLGFDLVWS
jgi:hypothetical protein